MTDGRRYCHYHCYFLHSVDVRRHTPSKKRYGDADSIIYAKTEDPFVLVNDEESCFLPRIKVLDFWEAGQHEGTRSAEADS